MHQLLKATLAALLIALLPAYADNGYDTDFVDLVEIVYGQGYLSQGGSKMVEQMFQGIDLEKKRILDIGCGVGGPALHLAKNYNVSVVGIDPETSMIRRSQEALDKLQTNSKDSLKGSAYFAVMEDPLSLQQFPDNSFDIVTSKESILHVPLEHKQNYFREIFRVLKKGGQLVILDWLHRSPNYTEDISAMMEMDGVPFHLTTFSEYHQTVLLAGFSDVAINDLTGLIAKLTQQDLITIDAKQNQIIERFDQETCNYAHDSWNIQAKAFEDRELLVGLITAVKD
ncbi:MAG: 2-methoxy-6-polyprenyl-1,4-benzoquinol methylase, mitochondrial [Chlamydiae bacterium]|nr:2-methoxy-6-polyprenyl-1,4-benzoquinol methylase, mitochondrial [Chlamydiota bacterium]